MTKRKNCDEPGKESKIEISLGHGQFHMTGQKRIWIDISLIMEGNSSMHDALNGC